MSTEVNKPQSRELTPSQRNVSTVKGLLEKMKGQLLAALPKHISPDRMARIALTEMRKVPKLAECDPMSFCSAIMACSQLGLEPNAALGHIYLLPYKNNQKGISEVQVILGYKGMIELARRSGQIVSLAAHEVHENDTFEFQYGLEEKLVHKPTLQDRGDLIAVYAIAHFVGGGHQIEVMSKHDIDAVRKRSKSSGAGPWVSDFSEMAKKTVVRRLFKYLPVSIEKVQQATMLDEGADNGNQNIKDVFDGHIEGEIDFETGEIIEAESTPVNQADNLADKIK